MKIDVFCHILTPKYKQALYKAAPPGSDIIVSSTIAPVTTLYNLDHRFKIMDKFGDLRQVITLCAPPIEQVGDSKVAADLSKLANDELAELVSKYPDRFAAGVACLPMNNINAALKEVDRALKDLKLRGVQIYTPINDKPLDSPEFLPLYEKMSEFNLPIWIHPTRDLNYADYRSEDKSKYNMYRVFGWVYETTLAMSRLVFSGIMEKYPGLKFITHHCGAMIPYFQERLVASYERAVLHLGQNITQGLSKPAIDYFKMFYVDTAITGNPSALVLGYDFYGADHLLYGTDMPFDTEYGERLIRQVTKAVDDMTISKKDKDRIFAQNTIALLRLDQLR